ncbi:hypothetical protein KFE94_14535 [bacterium SCSIO 12643]|nr:hypothetical protein KFE94_14535 [bacterium SCSIO 12643]
MSLNKRLTLTSSLYFLLVLFIYIFHFTAYDWTEFISKPIALSILIYYFGVNSKKLPKGLKKGIILGLIFSILSDISFLLRVHTSQWFIIGTFTFSLLAIYSYAQGFQHTSRSFLSIFDFKSITMINLFLSLLIIVFPISIFVIEDLQTWQYPAILYQILLWILVSQGLKRQDHVNEKSYYLVLTGIVLYSITTMLLTLQNFTQSVFNFESFPVLTYFISQYFIAVGAIYQAEPENTD